MSELNLDLCTAMLDAMKTPEYQASKDHLVIFRSLAARFPHWTDEEAAQLLNDVYNATRSQLRPALDKNVAVPL